MRALTIASLCATTCALVPGCGPGPDISSSDPAERQWAVRRTSDQPVLASIALSDPDPDVRAAALDRLRDPDELGRVAATSEDPELARRALDEFLGVADESELVAFAVSATIEDVRDRAAWSVKADTAKAQLVLGEWRCTASEIQLRSALAGTIRSAPLLAEIALKATHPLVGWAAVSRINDPSALESIAGGAAVPVTRAAALLRIADREAISRIVAQAAPAESVHNQLQDIDRAREALADGTAPAVRTASLDQIQDPALLGALLLVSQGPQAALRLPAADLESLVAGPPEGVLGAIRDAKLAAAEPILLSRLPGLTLDAEYRKLEQRYTLGITTSFSSPGWKVIGEELVLAFRAEAGALASGLYQSDFPVSVDSTTSFVGARVDLQKLLTTLVARPELSPDDLGELAASARTASLRRAAVGGIKDQTRLSRIARGDPDKAARLAAVENLAEARVLASIAEREVEDRVAYAAIERLEDQRLLQDLAKNERLPVARRRVAIESIVDQPFLVSFIEGENDAELERAAIGQLSDGAVLERIVRDRRGYDIHARLAATKRITDQALLAELATRDRDVGHAAAERLNDQAVLARLAFSDDVVMRMIALDNLTAEALLTKVAIRSLDESIAERALAKISSADALAQVADSAHYAVVRQQAAARIASAQHP